MAADKEPLLANCYLLSLNKSQQNYLQFSYNKLYLRFKANIPKHNITNIEIATGTARITPTLTTTPPHPRTAVARQQPGAMV